MSFPTPATLNLAACGKGAPGNSEASTVSLDDYRRKRDPQKTPEPFRDGGGRGSRPIFVVQRHDARRLHYDFRLERDGALASWAVPKGVPLEPGARALAVHVEDHPLEYASFHGEIPHGQYGAGTVEIWDSGTYDLVEEKPGGQLTFELRGSRLHGRWSLVPAHLDGKEQNWLLIKGSDGEDDSAPARSYRPMLATLADAIPHGELWSYEVKFDGYRALAHVRGGDCTLVSRNDNDLTGRFPEVAKAIAKAVKSPNAVVDGEVARIDASGRASFSELQRGTGTLVFYAFDLLELDGEPQTELPLRERKDGLRKLLDARVENVVYSESFDDGDALFQVARERGLEGVVAKRVDSVYREGRRTRDWLKIKTEHNEEFVVAGYTRGGGRRAGTFGSLVLAVNEGGELRYVGNVGTGFDDAEIRKLLALLEPLRRDLPPFPVEPKLPRVRKGDVHWVEPRVDRAGALRRVDARRAPPPSGLPRHPGRQERRRRWSSSRTCRPCFARDVASCGSPTSTSCSGRTRGSPRATCSGTTGRSHRCSCRTSAAGRSRCAAIPTAPTARRSSRSTRRRTCRTGSRRHRALVSTREGSRAKKWVDFPIVNDELALLWMVNMGCIDLNTWYSRVDKPDRPDFVLFDLDPTPEVPWSQTVEVALILKELLDALELESFPKTSGGKGFHVLVPIDRRSTFEDTRAFCRACRRRDRANASEARHDRMVEGAAARCPDRLESERRGQDDRVGLFGTAEARRAGVDAAVVETR